MSMLVFLELACIVLDRDLAEGILVCKDVLIFELCPNFLRMDVTAFLLF